MKNLILDSKTRDEIVKFLQSQIVPAQVGAGLIQVCSLLNDLKEAVKEEKTDDKVEEPKA